MRHAVLILPLVAAPLAAQQPDSTAAARDSARRRLPPVRVVVPGDAAPPSPLLSGAATSVVSAARIAAMPMRVLPDALREVPGVQVQQTNAGHGTVVVRGLTGNQLLVVVDGVRLNTTTVRDGPSQYLATLDPEQVAAVEVVRGPGAVLFGSDAMGGVVHVRTRRPAATSGWRAAAAASGADGGAMGRVEGNLAGAVAGRAARLRAGTSALSAGDVVAGGALGGTPATGYRARAADAALEVDVARCLRVDASVQGMELRGVQRYDRLFRYRDPVPGPSAEFLFDPQRNVRALARLVRAGCDGARVAAAQLQGGTQWQDEGRRERARSDGGTTYLRDDVYTRFATAWLEPRVREGTVVRVGADAYEDRVSSEGWTMGTGPEDSPGPRPTGRTAGGGFVPAGRFPNGARHALAGAYVHAAQLVGGRTRLLAGTRWDRSHVRLRAGDDFGGDVDAVQQALSGQLGVAHAAGGGVTIGAHAGTGFRAPNTYDMATVSSVPGGVQLPSPALAPERSVTAEAHVAWEGRRASVQLVAHQARVRDLVDRVPSTYRGDTLLNGERVFRSANLGRARVTGLEGSARVALGAGTSARALGAWTRGTQWTSALTPAGTLEQEAQPMPRIPPVSGTLALRRDLAWRRGAVWGEVVSRGALAQRRLSPRDERDSRIARGGTPGWVTLGVRAGLTRGAWRASAGAENLTDRGYREHGSGIDAPGRHAWLRLERVLD